MPNKHELLLHTQFVLSTYNLSFPCWLPSYSQWVVSSKLYRFCIYQASHSVCRCLSHSLDPQILKWALAGWLRCLECHPHTPRSWAWSLVKAHTRNNQWVHGKVEKRINLSLSLSFFLSFSLFLSLSFPPFLYFSKVNKKWQLRQKSRYSALYNNPSQITPKDVNEFTWGRINIYGSGRNYCRVFGFHYYWQMHTVPVCTLTQRVSEGDAVVLPGSEGLYTLGGTR